VNVRATCKPALGDADCQPEYMGTRADEAIEYVRGRITWEAADTPSDRRALARRRPGLTTLLPSTNRPPFRALSRQKIAGIRD
jgi:hypothetical protein